MAKPLISKEMLPAFRVIRNHPEPARILTPTPPSFRLSRAGDRWGGCRPLEKSGPLLGPHAGVSKSRSFKSDRETWSVELGHGVRG